MMFSIIKKNQFKLIYIVLILSTACFVYGEEEDQKKVISLQELKLQNENQDFELNYLKEILLNLEKSSSKAIYNKSNNIHNKSNVIRILNWNPEENEILKTNGSIRARVHTLIGTLLQFNGFEQLALEEFKKAISLYSPLDHFFLNYVDNKKLISFYHEQILNESYDLTLPFKIANAYFRIGIRGNLQEAVNYYNLSLAILSRLENEFQEPIVFFFRGQALHALRYYESAIKDYDRVIALTPSKRQRRFTLDQNKRFLMHTISAYYRRLAIKALKLELGNANSFLSTNCVQMLNK